MSHISVIIPCYNQGQYIDEAVDSVLNQTFQDFEIIIVNDGSTDELTNKILNNYKRPKTKVITTVNRGLSAARNTGILNSKGQYILPLDADDKISIDYLELAVNKANSIKSPFIIYSDAHFFGTNKTKWELPDFELNDFLLQNSIFCSAFYRKIDWEKVGGYNVNMKYGNEDWDFWLSLIEIGATPYKIPKVCFFYRQKENSMLIDTTSNNKNSIEKQIFINHKDLYLKTFGSPISIMKENSKLHNHINVIKNSKSYKLGNLIIHPIKKIVNLFTTLKLKITTNSVKP